MAPQCAAPYPAHRHSLAQPRTDGRSASPRISRVPEVVEVTDRDRWNALVRGRPAYELEQGWEWGEIQRTCGGRPHRYAAFAGPLCVGLASVVARRLPGLPGSILDACRGPLIDPDDDLAWHGLLSAIRRLAEREHSIALRVSPNVRHDDVAFGDALVRHGFRPLPDEWTTWSPARVALTMRLDGDEARLRGHCRKSLRNEISAAYRRGVSIRSASDAADLAAFHRLAAGRKRGHPLLSLSRMQALWSAYVADGNGVLLLAEHAGALIGGLLGVRLGERAYLQYAAATRTAARLYPGALVYWEFIRWAKAAGCTHLDWGGSGTGFPPCESDLGYGLYQFKVGFGSELHYCAPYHDLVFRPALYRLGRTVETWALPTAWRLRALLNG